MRKIQFIAVVLTLMLALPFAALAIITSGLITDNLLSISNTVASISIMLFEQGKNIIFEAEIAGLIAGLAIITALIIFTRLVQ